MPFTPWQIFERFKRNPNPDSESRHKDDIQQITEKYLREFENADRNLALALLDLANRLETEGKEKTVAFYIQLLVETDGNQEISVLNPAVAIEELRASDDEDIKKLIIVSTRIATNHLEDIPDKTEILANYPALIQYLLIDLP